MSEELKEMFVSVDDEQETEDVLHNDDDSLVNHAIHELKLIGMDPNVENDMNADMANSIIELIKVFSQQGHTGSSAPYCASMFEKLARFETLSPLTGDDDEWVTVTDNDGGTLYQNNRASNVFKNVDRKTGSVYAYQYDYYIYVDHDGCSHIRGLASRNEIAEWPYTPDHEVRYEWVIEKDESAIESKN